MENENPVPVQYRTYSGVCRRAVPSALPTAGASNPAANKLQMQADALESMKYSAPGLKNFPPKKYGLPYDRQDYSAYPPEARWIKSSECMGMELLRAPSRPRCRESGAAVAAPAGF